MNEKHRPDSEERLAALEQDVAAIKDSLSLLVERRGELGGEDMAGGFGAGAYAKPPLLHSNAYGLPIFLFSGRRLPFSFPTQRLSGLCSNANAMIQVPGPGNYILTINVPRESDCSVLVTDPADITAFGPVGPGDSLSRLFTFYTPRLIASCQGRGDNCIGEITLTQIS